MDGSIVFARWCQCAPPSMLPYAHLSPYTKRTGSVRFGCFCTAHGRRSLYFTTGRSPLKIILRTGNPDPHLICGFLCPCTRVHNPNGISIDSAVFPGLIVTDRPTDHACWLVAWSSGRALVFGRCAFAVLRSTCIADG